MRNRHVDYRTAAIKCPFFHGHVPTEISCEGILPDTTIKQIFPSKSARDRHEDIFCIDCYKNCEVYLAIIEKYEEGNQS